MFYLLLKIHNLTGLCYLCYHRGSRESCIKYKGSGKYWKNHYKVHGNDISTFFLLETNKIEEVQTKGPYFSKLWNVINSEEWANLCEENGKVGGPRVALSGSNHPMYGKHHSDITKLKMRLLKIGKPLTKSHCDKISKSNKGKPGYWKGRSHYSLTKIKMSKAHTGKHKGIKNNSWTGYWITPIGNFVSKPEVRKATKLSLDVIIKLCKTNNSLSLSYSSIRQSPFLLSLKAKPGQSPKDLGFGFIMIK